MRRDRATQHLAGVRVLEMGRGLDIAFCGKLLADLGADVTRCEFADEPPRSSDWRRDFASKQFLSYLDRHKSIAPTDTRPGRARVHEVWDSADCVLEDIGQAGLARYGLRFRVGHDPRAVVRVSDWGQGSPMAGRESSALMVQAAAGWVQDRDQDSDTPVAVGGRYEVYAVGVYAAVAALTGLEEARSSGESVTADLSRMACLHSTLAYPVTASEARGDPTAKGFRRRQPFGIMRCRDGWVGVNILTDRQWNSACRLVSLAEFSDRRTELAADEQLLDEFQERVARWLSDRRIDDVVTRCQEARVPAVPVADAAHMVSNPQFLARDFLQPLPGADGVRGPALPFIFTGPRIDSTSPLARQRVKVDDDVSRERPECSRTGSRPSGGSPFQGLRVLDLGSFWAGPYATCYLAGFGADVIKIESHRRPDGFRFVNRPSEGQDLWYEAAPLWQSTNLSKRSVALDLTTAEGRSIFLRLVEEADVVLENFSARVMDKFGLTYEHLAAANPRIVMVRMPGFGLSGPWRDYVGYGIAFEQIAGWAEVTGFRDGAPQTPGGYIDPIVGMHAVLAILAALRHRRQTGHGQQIEVAQAEVGASLAAEHILAHETGQQPSSRNGNRSTGLAPQGVYRTADSVPTWVAITVRDDLEWHRLTGVVGDATWLQPLEHVESRLHRHDDIDARLAAWTKQHDAKTIIDLLQQAGIPAGPVRRPADSGDDPTLAARGYFRELIHPVTGNRRYAGYPMKFSFAATNPHRHAPPLLGEDSAAVLEELLGIRSDEFDRLVALGAVGKGWQPPT